jgi:DNA-binding beta-propeller fold protein YncE
VYVLDPPRITPVDLAHHRTGRPVVIPGSVAAALVAVTPDHRRAYVLTGTSLVPVSLITGAAGRPLTVPQDSSQVDYLSTDGRTAYLVAGSTITPVDLRTGSAGRPFVLPPLSSNSLDTLLVAASAPVACLTGITASGPQEYVIECVNLATGTTGKPITVPGAGGSAAALSPDGRSAYIASDSLLVPVNLVTGSTGRPIHTPIHIGAVAVTTDGRTAYVGNLKPYHPDDGVIIPIDLARGTAHAAIPVPSYPYSITDIVISRDGRTAYAAAYSSVIPINIATGKPAKPIPMPSDVSAVILTA